MTEQVPLTGQGRLREGGAEGRRAGSLLVGARAHEESQIFCNQQQHSLDRRYLSPAPGPTPSAPPHRLHAASNEEKKRATQNKGRPQNAQLYMRGKQGRQWRCTKLGGVKLFVYMSTEENRSMKASLRLVQVNNRRCHSAFPFGAQRSSL